MPDLPGLAITASAIAQTSSDVSSGILEWLAESAQRDPLVVEQVPLDALDDWHFDADTGNLSHRLGGFFSVTGLRITTNVGSVPAWMQPAIDQPEVGILGFLVGHQEGILRFLVQRKMEPGNINISQVSPTVQATRSNYRRLHGGASPRYVEYFRNAPPQTILIDQLQAEQGSRYVRKLNRNMVVQVEPGDVPLTADYRWVSLGELLPLARVDNALNFDTRSVLSCLPFSRAGTLRTLPGAPSFPMRVWNSLTADCEDDRLAAIASWLAGLQQRLLMTAQVVPLRDVVGWRYDGQVIRHDSGRFFEVLGVTVGAATREVPRWNQPLLRSVGRGIHGFLCQEQEGVLRCLVKGAPEPGALRVMMGPTLQCIPENHDTMPPFFNEIVHAEESRVRFRTIQSEEGGRFYHDQRLLSIVELPSGAAVDCPPEYLWMTLGELKEMIARDGNVNVEARSLIACMPISI